MDEIAVALAILSCLLIAEPVVAQQKPQTNPKPAASVATVRVDTIPQHILNSFDPDRALGSSVDVLSRSGIDKVYTPHILQESLSAGWGPITYRNNTELRMAAWHWTENGSWSDPEHKSGYFTGSTELKEPTRYILAYALPHRGFSTSGDRPAQGPNLTYWKSNPYLTSKFTKESDALHPQWVIVDLRVAEASERRSHRMGESLRQGLPGGVLGRQRRARLRSGPRRRVEGLPFRKHREQSWWRRHIDPRASTRDHAVCARAHDGVLEHLRRTRIARRTQLRRLRHARAAGRYRAIQAGRSPTHPLGPPETQPRSSAPRPSIPGIPSPTSTTPATTSTRASISSSPAASPTICPP